MTPLLIKAAEVTPSPSTTSTGRLSPVIAHLSTNALPFITVPSAGIYSPCFTISISPSLTSLTEICFCSPSISTVTVSGASFKSFSTSLPVFFLDFSSSHLPTVTRVRIIAADSKCKFIALCISSFPKKISTVSTSEYKNDTPEPSATNVSILGTFLNTATTPFLKKA